MLNDFLQSKLSGYLAIGSIFVIAALLFGLWLWGQQRYDDGFNACDAAYIAASQANKIQSKQGADDVRKKISRLDDAALDAELCRLGIVQQDSGCQ